jgi:hypothetical protein
MQDLAVALVLALQETAAHNATPVLGVGLMAAVIGVVMICLLILAVLSFSARSGRRNRTRS